MYLHHEVRQQIPFPSQYAWNSPKVPKSTKIVFPNEVFRNQLPARKNMASLGITKDQVGKHCTKSPVKQIILKVDCII